MKVGCLSGPLAGLVASLVMWVISPSFFESEIGPIPALFWLIVCVGPYCGSLLGGFIGTVVDACRNRSRSSVTAMVCMGIIVLVLVIAPLALALWK